MRGVEGLELVEGVVFPTGIPKGPFFFLLKTRTEVSDLPKTTLRWIPVTENAAPGFEQILVLIFGNGAGGGPPVVRVGLDLGQCPVGKLWQDTLRGRAVPSRPVQIPSRCR